ncbi:hypothetical protein STXM2123_5886 [Streptomyces sp. F-3]|nr:hypothetical protein STXM2123_5886 [Streptomyces sp. F-3]
MPAPHCDFSSAGTVVTQRTSEMTAHEMLPGSAECQEKKESDPVADRFVRMTRRRRRTAQKKRATETSPLALFNI